MSSPLIPHSSHKRPFESCEQNSQQYRSPAKRSRPLETTLPSIRLIPELHNKPWQQKTARKSGHSHSLTQPQSLTCITNFASRGSQTGPHSPESYDDGSTGTFTKPLFQQQQQHQRHHQHHERSVSFSTLSQQQQQRFYGHSTPLQQAFGPMTPPLSTPRSCEPSPIAETARIARNWSREETLSLVRAIGRHYSKLRQCKTNQERSSVWRQVHHEHSSRFPGRSKKASQDRWGKVLSDYKDVMIHNKEKGAARWTFDFFEDVAAILRNDASSVNSSANIGTGDYSVSNSNNNTENDEDTPAASSIHSSPTSPTPTTKFPEVIEDSSLTAVQGTKPGNNISSPMEILQHHQQQPSHSPSYLADLLRRQLSKMDAQIRSIDILRQNTMDVLRHVESSLPSTPQQQQNITTTTTTQQPQQFCH